MYNVRILKSVRAIFTGVFLILALTPLATAGTETSSDLPGCTTEPAADSAAIHCIGTDLAELGGISPPGIPFYDRGKPGTQLDGTTDDGKYDWQLIDTLTAQPIIGNEGSFAIRYHVTDHILVGASGNDDPLTDLAVQALDAAPEWLYSELYTNFSEMNDSNQDEYAQLIIDTPDPYKDEVAFQVAHISYGFLPYIDSDLLEVNANLLYDNDAYLDYVNIVDYGSSPGDYYSTVEYCVDISGTPTWIEAPKEIYYWYVVHPKCSDEKPKMDSTVYNEFWREFLFDYTHASYLNRELYDVLSDTSVVWDRQMNNYTGSRSFDADDTALDVIGNWVSRHIPVRASSPRPIQPNQVITDHNGNCGELQDLLCAGTRAALIPCASAMDICEDHVWCEFWDEGWHPYQVSWGAPVGQPAAPGPTHVGNYGICYDADQGGSKEISGIWDWRGDGFNEQVIDNYSEYCTLAVTVHDTDGNLVDGGRVRIATESIYGGYNYTAWETTDSSGIAYFVLGDDDPGCGPSGGRDYFVRVDSYELYGGYPDGFAGSGTTKIIEDAIPGGTYAYTAQLIDGDTMPLLDITEAEYPANPLESYKFEIEYSFPDETKFGRNCYGGVHLYNYVSETGNVDFFVCDPGNYDQFLNGDPFEAFVISEDSGSGSDSFIFPDTVSWHGVFSNADHLNCFQAGDVTVRVYWNTEVGIEFEEFIARAIEQGIEVYWDTASSDESILGWNLYRSDRVSNVIAGGGNENPISAKNDLYGNRFVGNTAAELNITESTWRKLNGVPITGQPPYEFLDYDVTDGNRYSYKLEAIKNDGNESFGPVSATAGYVTPSAFALAQNRPNPSDGEAVIDFAVPRTSEVHLELFDIKGRKIAVLAEGLHQPGEYSVDVNGLSNGIYLYRLKTDGFIATRKMVVK